MTAEDSKRLEVREIIRDTLAHHGHEGDELLEALMYELEASSMFVRADAMDRRLAQDRVPHPRRVHRPDPVHVLRGPNPTTARGSAVTTTSPCVTQLDLSTLEAA